jgi:hypothetical protein
LNNVFVRLSRLLSWGWHLWSVIFNKSQISSFQRSGYVFKFYSDDDQIPSFCTIEVIYSV